MRRLLALAIVAVSCYREAYPCDEETFLAMVAHCQAKYAECKAKNIPDVDCPSAAECDRLALDRQKYCAKQIQESP